jgi:hypothetical protein
MKAIKRTATTNQADLVEKGIFKRIGDTVPFPSYF